MKRFYHIISFCFFSSLKVIVHTQDTEYAKTVISQLASPEFKGRGYTEGGDKLAADFIRKEFMAFNLKPLFKNSFYQFFPVSVTIFPTDVLLKLNGVELSPAVDYLIESSCPPAKGSYLLKKVNRKELSDQVKLADIINNTVTSYLIIDNSDKTNETSGQSKKIEDVINYLKYSDQIPLKGLIIYTSEKLNWDASTLQNIRPVVILNKPIGLDSLKYIELSVKSRFLKHYKTQNVAGFIPGTVSPDSFIFITAHYDHLGMLGRKIYFPGANDNASGIAMLLSLARYYSISPPEYTMVFVALSAEELGLLGAFTFVDKSPVELKDIKFLINFDLAGTGDEGIKVVNGSIYKKEFGLLEEINLQHQFLPKIESRGKACNSDHCAFDEKGVPCFYIYTLGGIKAYHDIYDRFETLPLTEFQDYCNLIIQFFDSL